MPSALELIGHRGSPRERPENTLTSFERALANGADAVELDVHATAEGTVVVHHDASPRGSDRPIAVLADAELARHPIAGEAIPTLDAVLDLCAGKCRVYVEIKGRGIERAVVERIRAHRAECAVHSFDHRAIRAVRELEPGLRRGILLDAYLVDVAAALRTADAQDLWQQWSWIDEPLVAQARSAGARVVAWTVNEQDAARTLVSLGVTSLCSDDLPTLARLRA